MDSPPGRVYAELRAPSGAKEGAPALVNLLYSLPTRTAYHIQLWRAIAAPGHPVHMISPAVSGLSTSTWKFCERAVGPGLPRYHRPGGPLLLRLPRRPTATLTGGDLCRALATSTGSVQMIDWFTYGSPRRRLSALPLRKLTGLRQVQVSAKRFDSSSVIRWKRQLNSRLS